MRGHQFYGGILTILILGISYINNMMRKYWGGGGDTITYQHLNISVWLSKEANALVVQLFLCQPG